MNETPTISLVLRHAKKDYFQAHGIATQACLDRLLVIADFILRHPKAATEPLELTVFGGINHLRFVINEPIQLMQVARKMRAIQPSSPGVKQSSSLTFFYFDAKGDQIPDPVTEVFGSIIGETPVPHRLIKHIDSN